MSARIPFLALAATALLVAAPRAFALERSQVAHQYKWDLTALYPSEAAWQSARQWSWPSDVT